MFQLGLFLNVLLLKWHPLKRTKPKNQQHSFHQFFIIRNFLKCLDGNDSFTLKDPRNNICIMKSWEIKTLKACSFTNLAKDKLIFWVFWSEGIFFNKTTNFPVIKNYIRWCVFFFIVFVSSDAILVMVYLQKRVKLLKIKFWFWPKSPVLRIDFKSHWPWGIVR